LRPACEVIRTLTGCSGGDLSNYQASSYSNCMDTCGANVKCVGVSFVSTTNYWFVTHSQIQHLDLAG